MDGSLVMIRIWNRHTYDGNGIYVGRPSPLGNPYKVSSKLSREKVIDMYRDWLLMRLEGENPTSKAFISLLNFYEEEGELDLICSCSPLKCHAEVIREFLLEVIHRMNDAKKVGRITSKDG